MIELRHLRTLRVLEETGSLTAAASRLHLTQSALSHQVKQLEGRLGLALVNRASKPLRLTQAGHRLTELARQVLPLVDETLVRLKGLARGQTGRLAVASECHSCLEWLLPRLRRLRAQYPGVELDVVLSASFDPLPRLQAGAVDLVLSPDRRDLPGLVWLPLFGYEMRLAMSPRHRLAPREAVEPEELRPETLLVYPVERGRLDVFTRFLWPAGMEPARVRVVEATALMLELVALEQGVAALPDWLLAEALAAGRIRAARLGRAGLQGTLYACLRASEAGLPHLAAFVASCKEELASPRQDLSVS